MNAGIVIDPLLLLKVGWDMENISDQQKDPFNQQVVFFLPILPAQLQ